jgi:hypothetical protein
MTKGRQQIYLSHSESYFVNKNGFLTAIIYNFSTVLNINCCTYMILMNCYKIIQLLGMCTGCSEINDTILNAFTFIITDKTAEYVKIQKFIGDFT